MTPLNGDKIRPRLAVRAGDKTFSWLFDTGTAVTCMNKQSFDMAFGHTTPKQISKPQSCAAASGDKMSSYGVFEVDLFIKGKKFTHPVNMIEELNENIIGIDFIHAHKLAYDVISRKVIFCVPKKQGQGLRIVQDFRELNQNSHIDKYSMKEITECIGDIGTANSNIFTTLDLTSGFWQMQLDEDSQNLTAFTIPGKGQFHWITSRYQASRGPWYIHLAFRHDRYRLGPFPDRHADLEEMLQLTPIY
jgi:hypothetical protein